MKPVTSLSLDLDNRWSYLKAHGDNGWESFPSYLDLVVPRILDVLARHSLTISFFVVGQDAALKKNYEAVRSIASAGHEIGNHSFSHEPWFHLYSEEQVDREITETEEHIQLLTGQKPVGFRGPGFSLSDATLRILVKRGYEYDATTLPNLLNPIARTYYLMSSKLSREEKRRRRALFGTLGDALRPVKPYRWKIEGTTLIEIPVTTMPIVKIPIHFTYLQWLSTFSHSLARLYFHTAIKLCQWTNTAPSLLLHPLDFLGADDDIDLGFFPGMKNPSQTKIALIEECLAIVTDAYTIVPMRQYAEEIGQREGIRLFQPKFRHA